MPQYQGIWTLAQAAQLQSTQRWATDPLYRNTTLLLQADNAANGAQNNTFLDSSSNNFTITRNGNTTQGTFTPFSQSPGWWSNYFDGTGDYLATPANAAFNVGTASFTLEAWVFPTSFASARALFSFADTNVFYFNTSGLPVYGIFGVSDTTIGSTTVSLNAWTHVAFVRSGSTLTCYLNGISAGSISTSSSIGNSTSGNSIGQHRTGNYFLGYISNLRLANGSAIYTSNFIPSAIPLTITSQGASSTDVKLLTCQSNRFIDNSTANLGSGFALTSFADVSVQAFSPFAPQYQYTPSVTGGSGYFDGSGDDYLVVAGNAAFAFGTGDFTLEVWINPNSISTGTFDRVCATSDYNGSGFDWTLNTGSSSLFLAGSSYGFSINTRSWNHVVYTRSGTTLRGFLNGRLASYNTGVSQNITSTTVLQIGQGYSGTGYNGYMTGLRIIKGSIPTSYQTSSTTTNTQIFTPPTAPVTTTSQGATAGNVSLLLNYTNAGIYDGTMKNNLETVGNAQISTSVVKYGTGSMYFDGSGDYLFSPSSVQLNFGSGNFTVEGWFYITSNVSCGLVSKWTDGGNQRGWKLDNRSNNTITFYYSTTGADFPLVTFSNVSLPVNTWSHLALVRNNNVLTLYKDGVNVGSSSFTSTIYANTSQGCVGGWFVSTNTPETAGINAYPGYIDDLRITAGIARYTANFTPPTVALPRQ